MAGSFLRVALLLGLLLCIGVLSFHVVRLNGENVLLRSMLKQTLQERDDARAVIKGTQYPGEPTERKKAQGPGVNQ